MSTSVTSCVLVGVDPRPIRVEASLSGGRPQFIIVGLPDAAVRESRERVRSAMKASGFAFPQGRVVVSLSPADLPKGGATFDLPIALALVQATEGLGPDVGRFVAMGELSLRGAVENPIGAVVAASVAGTLGATAIVPHGSSLPVSCKEPVVSAETLRDAVEIVRGLRDGRPVPVDSETAGPLADMGDVVGQIEVRRGLEIAAAGGHHLLMVGPPGAGKSMLANRLPSILPPLSRPERSEVALVAAALQGDHGPVGSPPFRAPHHSISIPALVGGGSGIPTPGEITKAHRGVLFLDELGEFPPAVLDALRQPMESGEVLVARQAASVRFPSAVQIIAASNPCPCGYLDDRKTGCSCSQARKERYRARLSGPLLDRFDLRVWVSRVPPAALGTRDGESSATIRGRVVAARHRQASRGSLNRDLSATELARFENGAELKGCLSSEPALQSITARGWDRVRRVARTIADLAGTELTDAVHIKEAIGLRVEL